MSEQVKVRGVDGREEKQSDEPGEELGCLYVVGAIGQGGLRGGDGLKFEETDGGQNRKNQHASQVRWMGRWG